MKKKSTIYTVIAALAVTLYLFFINQINIAIRLHELAVNLQELDINERNIDHIGLIATYEINKKIYEQRLTPDEADSLQHIVASLVIRDREPPRGMRTQHGFLALPALWLINFNRTILGKRPIRYNPAPDSDMSDIDVAYYYERNFMFNHAIDLYNKALTGRKIDNRLRASILLHQGYCYALSGLNDKARQNYLLILEEYPQENSAVTAAILLKYLEGFQLARDRILDSNESPITMSRDLMNLLAYKQALKILTTAEQKAAPKDMARIKYFMARCYTGLGQSDKAINSYIDIIKNYPSSDYARYSNRKILLIGTRRGDKQIIEASKKINTRLKDPVFDQMAHDNYKIAEPAAFSGLIKTDLPEILLDEVESYTKTIVKTPAKPRVLIILTDDGNTFKGTVARETSAEIVLNTSIGTISVKKEKITRITAR